MKHGLIWYIGFLMMITSGCKSARDRDLHLHLIEISKINRNVPLNNWKISVGYQGDLEHRYELEKSEFDTSYYVYFSYSPIDKVYDFDAYVITYFVDSTYHELSLFNNDTLYHLFAVTEYNLLTDRPPQRTEKHFIKGREYYIKERRLPINSLNDPVY